VRAAREDSTGRRLGPHRGDPSGKTVTASGPERRSPSTRSTTMSPPKVLKDTGSHTPWLEALTTACGGADLPTSPRRHRPVTPSSSGCGSGSRSAPADRSRSHASRTRQASAVFAARPRSRSRSRPTSINTISSSPGIPSRTSTRTTATAWRPSAGRGVVAFRVHPPSQPQITAMACRLHR